MIDTSKYTAYYSADKSRIVYLADKVRLATKTHGTVYTDFLTPEEAMILKRICSDSDEHVQVEFSSGNMDAEYEMDIERTIGAIFLYEREGEYPYSIVRIWSNPKFEKLEHRDFLGSILALGIKREKIGDINVFDDGAEVYVHSDICDYVLFNLDKVKHSGIKTNIIADSEARGKKLNFKESKVIVTSLRLDCVVAGLINQSRTKATDLIKTGNVKLNYSAELETNTKVNIKSLVSIKGYGRFIIDEMTGLTKSERITLLIKKYQ